MSKKKRISPHEALLRAGEDAPEAYTVESVESLIETALTSGLETFIEQDDAVMRLGNIARWREDEVGELAIWGLGEIAKEHPIGGISSQAADRLDVVSKYTPDGSHAQKLAKQTVRDILKTT